MKDSVLMQIKAKLVIAFVFCSISMLAQDTPRIVFNTGFSEDTALNNWQITGDAELVQKNDNNVVRLSSGYIIYRLPAESIKGTDVQIYYRLKAKKISTPADDWGGLKIQLRLALPWEDNWVRAELPTSGGDWIADAFTVHIPDYTDSVFLEVGLEQVTGKVWLDSISVCIAKTYPQKQIDTLHRTAVYTGHKEDKLRGVMIPTNISDTELRELHRWGVNLVRWQFMMDGFPFSRADWWDEKGYREWLESTMQHVDSLLPLCKVLGIKVLLDLHTTPGGKYNGTMVNKIFVSKQWQDAFIDIWKGIANRYKNETTIWGYDIANEPHEGPISDSLLNWYDLATLVSKNIRSIDTIHAIIIESAPDANIEGLCKMEPIPVNGVVYSFHFYVPLFFTHQALTKDESITYPGKIVNKEWNIATMRKALQAVKTWQERNNVHVYIGEFSAIRWAPNESAYYYIRDCIELFEEFGWDWTYHAFRGDGFNGWSAEHGNDKRIDAPAVEPTERLRLLQKWFSMNQHN